MLFNSFFSFTLKFYLNVFSKITGKTSLQMNKLFLSFFILFSAFDVLYDILTFHNFIFFILIDLILIGYWLFSFHIIRVTDQRYFDTVASKYEKGSVVLLPALFPNQQSKYHSRYLSITVLAFVSFINLMLAFISLIATHFIMFFHGLNSFLFLSTICIYYANSFFYSEGDGKSLYSKVKASLKNRIANRKRVVSFAPIGV
jgi:hypothetical protein